MFYDFLISLGLIMIATFLAIEIVNHGQPIGPHQRWFLPYLLLVLCAYFAGSWAYRGQTVGMRAWKLRLVNETGNTPTAFQVILRFYFAIPAITLALPTLGWTLKWLNRRSNTWLANAPE